MAACSTGSPAQRTSFYPDNSCDVSLTPRFSCPSTKSREGPPWLEKFLNCTYFGPCEKHQFHKNEKNHFCIDCMDGPLCSHGLISSHGNHRTLQVRRASHADGVRVDNLSKLLDISGIQTYIINNNRIVFLLRQAKGKLAAKLHGGVFVARHCQICGRLLSDLVKFCSIKCKLLGIRRQQELGEPATLSLSPEVSSCVEPSITAHDEIFHDMHSRKYPTFASHPNFALMTRKVLEEYSGREELDVIPITASMNCDPARKAGSVVSPVSVLYSIRPYDFKHGALPALTESMDMEKRSMSLGGRENQDMQNFTTSKSISKDKSILDMALIHRLFLSGRKRKRKSCPHRAPLC
ncbi:hypothetical protein KP509_01G009800 [Ceratopteris richardii]|uniref:PLATZ transcription factor family protein n=1 Tax=Ceratopteris richardii TaxID=49495 RepID=A0A8T2VEC6_CERRI|nr:hypothetical protein KP509_01G009800 [Ceratopteris richardii]KAH7445449.1 hypothetical protein KP509_01G009800 [Ceratopteris richardii]